MPPKMPECLLLQPITVLDGRPVELTSRALETRPRDKARLLELVA